MARDARASRDRIAPPSTDAIAIAAAATVTVALAWTTAAFPSLVSLEGAVSFRGLLVLAAGLALGGLFFRFPSVAVCALVAFVFLNLSEVLVRRHHVPSLLQVSFVPLALVAAWTARDGGRLPPRVLTALLGALVGTVLLSTLVAADPWTAHWRVIDHVKGLAVYVVLVMLVQSPAAARWGAWTLVGSAAGVAGLAIVQVVTDDFTVDFGGLARIKQAHIYGSTFEPRIAGPLGDPNFFAQVLVLALPFALSLAGHAKDRRHRLLAWGMAAAISTACLFTYSRGGALALAAVLAATALRRGVELRTLLLGGVLAVPLAVVAVPAHFADRLTTLGELLPGAEDTLRPDSSFEERKVFAAAAWKMFTDHPLSGVGAGNYATHFLDYTERLGSDARLYVTPEEGYYPHNLYLEIAAETGLVGLIAWGAVIAACFIALSSARRSLAAHGDRGTADLASAATIALLGYLLTSLFLHGHFIRYLWLLFGFTGALHNLAARGSNKECPSNEHRPQLPAGTDASTEPANRERNPPGASDAAAQVGAPVARTSDTNPRVRHPVAVVVSRFPLVTETFILREITEMERQGQAVRLVPLIREAPAVVHREAEPWIGRALHVPFWSRAVVASNLRMMTRAPGRYVAALARVSIGSARSPNFLFRSLALFPKSVCLAERLEEEGIRHLHAHFATHPATTAWIVSMLTDATFSVTVHAHDIFVRHTLLRHKLAAATFVRAISQYNRDYLARRYPEVAAKTTVVHVGLDPEWYGQRARGCEPVGTSGFRPRIVAVAALRPYKGLPVLLDACAALRKQDLEFCCDIVGDGPLRGALEAQIHRSGLSDTVRLLGARPQHEVAGLLSSAALLVQPSVVAPDGQMEGIPVAILEGMATGLPVVASSLSGIPEAVADGRTGRLVEPGNAAALAAAIEQLLADPAASRRMGEEGRRVVREHFAIDDCVTRLLHLLDAQHGVAGDVPVSAVCSAAGNDDVRAIGVRRRYDGRDASVVQVVACGRRRHEWIVKRHRSRPEESRPAIERARHEYRVLCELASAGNGSLPVPRPLFFDPATACIVMEACRGHRLDELIRLHRAARGGPARQVLDSALTRTGEWLRHFHQRPTVVEDPSPALDRVLARAHRDLDSCAGLHLPPRLAASVRSQLAALAAQLDTSSLRLTRVHGDFWPGNVFVDDHGVQGIDFEGVDLGMPYEDLAYFLVQLELFLVGPLAQRRLGGLAESFLRGYLQAGHGFEWVAYEICRVASALQVLASMPAAERSARPGLHLRRRVLRAIVAGGAS